MGNVRGQVAPDKKKHFIAGGVIAELPYGFLYAKKCNLYQASWVAGTSVLMIGGGKEMFDAFNGKRFSWRDYGATCLGGLSIMATNIGGYYLVQFVKKKRKKRVFDPDLIP
jgi:hypothetical protein